MTQFALFLIALPAVFLSAEHEAMCRVGVGDPMPALALRSPTGQSLALGDFQGERATVVALHGAGGWMTDTLLADLGIDIAQPYASEGVRVVAVGLDQAATTSSGVTAMRISSQEASSALGSGRGPRVYVLDSEGKIVWFDIEYSLATRRELLEVVASFVDQRIAPRDPSPRNGQ